MRFEAPITMVIGADRQTKPSFKVVFSYTKRSTELATLSRTYQTTPNGLCKSCIALVIALRDESSQLKKTGNQLGSKKLHELHELPRAGRPANISRSPWLHGGKLYRNNDCLQSRQPRSR